MKNLIYTVLGLFITSKANALNGGLEKIDVELTNGGIELVPKIDNILGYIISLFYFIAVVFMVYGGFLILTSSGDEDKVKSGKKVIIFVAIGLVVIFLTSQFVHWIVKVMTSTDIVG